MSGRFPVPRGVDAAPSRHAGTWPPAALSLLRNVQSLKRNFEQQVWPSFPRTILRSKASEYALEKGLSDTSLGFSAHPGAFC